MINRDLEKLREYCLHNATGLISPANSGMILALAIFELADAQREHTQQMRSIGGDFVTVFNGMFSTPIKVQAEVSGSLEEI